MNRKWSVLGTGFIVLFFGSGTIFTFGLILPEMSEDLGWSRSSITLAFATFMVVSALAMPIVGRIVDRGYDIRLILSAAIILVAIGTGLIWIINDYWQLLLLYGVVFAIGFSASSIPSVNVMVSRWWPQSQGMANSAVIAGMGLGQLVMIAILTSMMLTIGWRNIYGIIGLINLIIILPIVILFARSKSGRQKPDSDISEPSSQREPPDKHLPPAIQIDEVGFKLWATLAKSKYTWLLIGMFGICGFQDFFVATHIVSFARDNGIGNILAGNILALMGLMGLAGVIISGYMTDRFGPAIPTIICFIVRTIIFALILNSQNTPNIVVFAMLYGSTFLITAPLVVVFAQQIFGSKLMGVTSGFTSSVHQVFGGLGAYIGALTFDNFGSYNLTFIICFGLSILAILVSSQLHRAYLTSKAQMKSFYGNSKESSNTSSSR